MIKVSISIDVWDIKKWEEFYTQALWCKRLREQMWMIVLATKNVDIYLQEKKVWTNATELSNRESKRDYKRHWTPIHLDFLCDNVDEVVSKVLKLGGTHEGGESADWGAIAHCADPFGNGFCLINEWNK